MGILKNTRKISTNLSQIVSIQKKLQEIKILTPLTTDFSYKIDKQIIRDFKKSIEKSKELIKTLKWRIRS